MFSKIYNILEDLLGPSKQGCYSDDIEQYQFNCIACANDNGGEPDGKHNLEIRLSQNGMVYHCWKCEEYNGTRGNLGSLIKKYGTYSMYRKFKEEVDNLVKSKLYEIQPSALRKNTTDDDITLPDTYTKINKLSECMDKRARDYLISRGFNDYMVKRYNIGYTTWDEKKPSLRNRIIIPSFDSFGDLNFWVGRDFSGISKIKYKNCDAEKKNIVFNESLIDFDSDILLCEGAIDCLCYWNAIPLLGKTLSKDSATYMTLMEKANGKVYICLDNDTSIGETKRLYRMLDKGRLKGKVWFIKMNEYKDIGEAYQKGGAKAVLSVIKTAVQFSEIDIVFE